MTKEAASGSRSQSKSRPASRSQGFAKGPARGKGPGAGQGSGKPLQGQKSVKSDAPLPPGLAAREAAVRVIAAVLNEGRSFEAAAAKQFEDYGLEGRDRGLARLIAATVLRRQGELEAILDSYLQKPLQKQKSLLWPILLAGAAQLLFLQMPPHAAVGLAVDQARRDRQAAHFNKLVNALLRRVSREGAEALPALDGVALNIPQWLMARWRENYGADTARKIGAASLAEAPLDISVKSDPQAWAEKLGGTVLSTGSVRLAAGGRIEDMPGFSEGAWWVQDAAAALPAKLMGDVRGKSIVDLCAAPGGKTAQLVSAGAEVTALDLSPQRIERLQQNLARLGLSAETVAADAGEWAPERTFDGVLLDVPCTATGTIRRHPDILRLKRLEDIAALAEIQSRLLDQAAKLVAPGGMLLYCTCSLDAEEGERQIARFLERNDQFQLAPIKAGESGIAGEWLTPRGELRTLPFHTPSLTPGHATELPTGEQGKLVGMDGFYAARLVRQS
ncbi:RsmB/NOP family class I SAM-dependent RNA methyltransferase [Hyphomicrobium sulfonivorans]|uniref:RsmB/NOP family class I SAM-dependent RNA methyltransferase n=1 Tax=Hyphomicrobium sulfonivorans TaxID=121290 RepID=UPI000A8B6FDE|nr:transcription antitermination factor NusB [Hyphomicrobium sulfonivorans]